MNKTYLKLALDLDFTLIAITAPLKDYTLCHKINTNLELEFEKIEDHEIFHAVEAYTLNFSKYYFFIEEDEQEYYLLGNKSSDGILIPEMANVDFFLIIMEYIDEEDLSRLITSLNRMPEIQVAAKIDQHKLRNRENLVL
ncbi:RIO-like serine/threonine protein kinase [Pedobacter sp. UYP30]|uniref:IPExxxVDY family protein n=1 Tax=Pedobacter sp. UYP30 TaxID=1756400 RepID=UPI0033976E99